MEEDPDDLEVEDVADLPDHTMSDEEVEGSDFNYSARAPGDFVISGPLPSGGGPGRRFSDWVAATVWARKFYGRKLIGRIDEAANNGGNRWAFLIRPSRAK